MPSPIPQLLGYLFDGFGDITDDLRVSCERWCALSPRFCTFALSHRDKMRKKIRAARDIEGLRDLQLELEIAYRLSRERRFVIAYEAYLADKTRGPDFTVSYTTRCTFNIEVRRLRSALTLPKWMDVLGDKLRQVPSSSPNVIVLASDSAAERFDIASAMKHIRILAEHKDADFFARAGFNGSQDFFRAFCRLSGLFLLQRWDAPRDGHLSMWLNPQAKHPIAGDVLSAIVHALSPSLA